METVTRFAPSPTGYLHIGHAYSALINFDQAIAANGRFVLRIEDIDQTRCRPEYEAGIFEDLSWLGLTWEEPVIRQSDRMELYEARLSELQERGLIYRCFKTRKDIEEAMRAPHDAPTDAFRSRPMAPIEERDNLAASKPYAWRLSMSEAETVLGDVFTSLTFVEETKTGKVESPAYAGRFGDVVLGRKDSGASYHLSSVLDDSDQGITHVTRGEDLRDAAGLHVLLYKLFDISPPVYRHHALITGKDGKRLAKRDHTATLRAMRENGQNPNDVKALLPSLTL